MYCNLKEHRTVPFAYLFGGVTLIPIPLPSHHRLRLTVLGLFKVMFNFPNIGHPPELWNHAASI
jgi:hypothetical protein